MQVEESQREAQRIKTNREELVFRIAKALPEDGVLDASAGFRLARASKLTEAVPSIFEPSLCIVAQGSKQVLLGDEVYRYDPGHYLIYTVDLPLTFQVKKATRENPYLGFRMSLDPSVVASVMMESDLSARRGDASLKAMGVGRLDGNLLDAVVRLVRVLDDRDQGRVLAPMIVREIIFRLLTSGQSARLSHLLSAGRDTHRISRAVEILRSKYNKILKMDELADELGMSVSGFHHHFKSVTAMSPLQFQKQIRLQEARRLMLADDLDAATAGFRVGYQDPAYFSRDYKKLFGAPPQRDISRLRSNLEK